MPFYTAQKRSLEFFAFFAGTLFALFLSEMDAASPQEVSEKDLNK